MRNIKEIENLDIAQLERISHDSSINVPSDLQSEISATVDSLDHATEILAVEETHRPQRLWLRVCGIAAAMALVAGIGLSYQQKNNQLVDTFDNPEEAYAMLEQTLLRIGHGMESGTEAVRQSNELISKPNEILNKTLK